MNEAKEYFTRAARAGYQLECFYRLADIYKTEENFPKAIEMLESSLQ